MVCLEHAESVCDRCDLSDCTLYYAHTLDELEDTRSRLEARLVAYETWRRDFAGLFLNRQVSAKTGDGGTPEKVDLETFEVSILIGAIGPRPSEVAV